MAPGMPDAEVADLRNAREQPGSGPGRPVDGRQHVDRGGHGRHWRKWSRSTRQRWEDQS